METTRHFTTKVYIVNEGATALHNHPGLGIHIPPGGHIERDELPHEAGLREVREETGLDPVLYRDLSDVEVPGGRPLPQPAHQILYDVNIHPNGEVGHQHINFIYYAHVSSRTITPVEGEVDASEWGWYTQSDLKDSNFDSDPFKWGSRRLRKLNPRDKLQAVNHS